MSSARRIVYLGAGGPFGTEMADALLRAGWNVTVLARKPSAVPPRSGATVVQFSPDDHASLVRAMRGAEVVLCTVSGGNADPFTLQKPLIDAAIEAGVPRFVPSEYAADMAHPKAVASPIYESRRKVIAYLKEKAEKGEISYTIFHTGGLFEFGLLTGFFKLDIKNHKAYIQNGGDDAVVMSTNATCAQATVRALSLEHFEATKNRSLRTGDASITENQLLSYLEKATGSKWAVVHENGEDNRKRGLDKLLRGEVDVDVVRDVIVADVYTKGGVASWGDGDNKWLGVEGVDLEKVVAAVVKQVDSA